MGIVRPPPRVGRLGNDGQARSDLRAAWRRARPLDLALDTYEKDTYLLSTVSLASQRG